MGGEEAGRGGGGNGREGRREGKYKHPLHQFLPMPL